ncbi:MULTISPECIES: flagellar biosynthesis protein FlhA [unclassified Idiomarina]|uniref:flagellar biosynthesis protein FlhA n=1 Tax=unclassified Idiomarina TaxID=2614829 RepID=UPI0008F935CF|nr:MULTISPECIES: flagellar biosynthesis protein FlhA [unclassified Idiomarina]MAD52992.1 flagellar biosynthesis protein FlhA [Idiomarinaceae bacterium]OIM99558.1 flagellar biosynthesis protein FlhA [Idiomarina sp. MD25a]
MASGAARLNNLKGLAQANSHIIKGFGTPLAVMAILAMVVLPIPPILLDILFSFSITLSLVVMLVAVYTQRPLDFAAFPTVLLIATVLRLSLNVASTRIVLLNGHEGPGAAGSVIEAFGSVVIGGNYTVGLVVFAILVIINFIVITKGAGRISEVTARFTLDAMPGKQMAIDADLNAGLINQEEAKARRSDVTREADFYGSMDGASKFVKGDAIAGILILLINVVGGFLIGMIQHDLSFGQAIEVYTLLTIGDGLVAQIPALLLSVATAIIITRENDTKDMGEAVVFQLINNPKVLVISSAVLFAMGVIPGMPHFAFLSMSAVLAGAAYYKMRHAETQETEQVEQKQQEQQQQLAQKELSWDDVRHVDTLGLEVGYRLIPLVDRSQGGELLSRIKGVRKKQSQEFGFLVPAVHIRDNLDLGPNSYRITLMGVTMGEADIRHDCELAINPGQVFGELEGEKTTDPAFGLEAIWIKPEQRENAQTMGYTVVDAATVVATHLSQIVTNHASQLLGHEEAQELLDRLGRSHPKLVEGLVPDLLSLGNFVKVLQNLLDEGIAIRDMRTIAQTLVEYAGRTQDTDVLTAAVRISLRRLIVQDISEGQQELPVITLAPELEQMLHQSLQAAGNEAEQQGAGIEPGLAERLQQSLKEVHQQQEMNGEPSVLLTSGLLRSTMARFARHATDGMRVLSYQEIPDDKQIRIVSSIGGQQQPAAQ